MWFRKKTDQEKPRLPLLQASKMLEDLFIQGNPHEEIKKMRQKYFIEGTETEVYLCFVALYLIAFMKTSQSSGSRMKQSTMGRIFRNLVDSFLAQQSHFGLLSMDPRAVNKRLKEITERLSNVWDQSNELPAGSDWYVGKEVYAILNGQDKTPPPDFVMYFSSLAKSYSRSIPELTRDIESKYTLVK